MIARNLELHYEGRQYFLRLPRLDNAELSELANKHGGKVHVKITKPESEGTLAQNAAMHALLQAYFDTEMHSMPESFGFTLSDFKIWIKFQYGPCHSMNMDGQMFRIPKSWTDYTKQERTDLIKRLLDEIYSSMAYAESPKLCEIIKGMEENLKMK